MASLNFNNTEIAFRSRSDSDLRKSRFLFRIMQWPWLVWILSRLASLCLALRVPVKPLIRATIYRQFCGGESLEACETTISYLSKHGIGSILNYALEGSELESEHERHFAEILRTISLAARRTHLPFCVFKVTGLVRPTLLDKLSRKAPLSGEESKAWAKGKSRCEQLCKISANLGVKTLIDAEESWLQPAIDDIAEEFMRTFNKKNAIVFHTAQMYRHDRLAYLQECIKAAKAGGYVFGIKPVRGAYMEKERERAHDNGYPSPILLNKTFVDISFDSGIELCLKNAEVVHTCIGTHNESSTLAAVALMKELGMANDDKRVFFAQLLGMSDHLSFNLSAQGYQVAKYVPYGPVDALFPYLVRRANENRAVQGQMSRELALLNAELRRRL